MKLNRDNKWYYVDKEEFKSLKEVLVEFHKFYSCEHEFLKRKIIFFFWFLLNSTLIMSLCEILYNVASAALA